MWLSFLLGGVVAGLLGYVVAKLGATYPSGGGLITYLVKGYGPGHVSAVVSWLLYFAALIVTSMVSLSFGAYACGRPPHRGRGIGHLVRGSSPPSSSSPLRRCNIRGTSAIDRIQSTIVILLLVVFAVFIVATSHTGRDDEDREDDEQHEDDGRLDAVDR